MPRRAALLALCAGLLGPASAHAQRLSLPGGTQPGGLRIGLLPGGQCSECHGGQNAPDGHTYLPADLWVTSMMANATRDPLFRATLAVAEQQRAGVGELCLRCHTPPGFVANHAFPGNGSALDPFMENDGVNCDTCHRSIDAHATDSMAPYLSNARLYFSDGTDTVDPTRFGPRSDPAMSTRHPSMGNTFTSDSRMCGQCHDVDNPLLHRLMPDGTDTGQPFPLQSTYTEWAQSDFSRGTTLRSCQNCHMPAETQNLVVSRFPGAPQRPMTRRHEFFGGNEWGLGMLRTAFAGEMDDAFDAARTRAQDFLRTAARLEVLDLPTQVAAGQPLSFRVRVTNLSGHKLPTGYEDARLMWIQVQVGDTVASGAMVNDELVEDAQLRAYRFTPGHLESGRVVPDDFVTQHQVVVEDTRIPPAGMMPNARTLPVGRDYSGGANGALRNDDTATFRVNAPTVGGPTNVTVRLLYRATTRHYVETIAAANRTDMSGQRLLDVWNGAGRSAPFAMATQQSTVMITGGTSPDAGGSDASAVDATSADASGTDSGMGADGGGGMPRGSCGCRAAGRASPAGLAGGALALLALLGAARRRSSRRG